MARKPVSEPSVADRGVFNVSGFGLLFLIIVGGIATALGLGYAFLDAFLANPELISAFVIPAVFIFILLMSGFFILEPNQAAVVLFFGNYLGVARRPGLRWTIPFTTRQKVSLRVETLLTNPLKVNDSAGNPIEIGVVVVYRVVDPARATLNVQDYRRFVTEQAETALRSFATRYPYDAADDAVSLRASQNELAEVLREQLAERLAVAGVLVMESRISHLAYATEIAAALLRRQQAIAIVAARRLITENAVEMARDAIQQLESSGVIALTDDRKAQLISNLMVALVADGDAQPVLDVKSG